MKRTLAALGAASIATVLGAALTAGAAHAQSYPGDPGAGVERGIQQLQNSGQVGTVTLFAHASDTLVFVRIHGAAHAESVRIYRGQDCEGFATMPAFVVSDLHGGVSRSLVHVGLDRLLSGNYNVVAFASTSPHAGAVACGHVYGR